MNGIKGWNKWSIVSIFSQEARLKGYLPPTSLYKPGLLQEYLGSYSSVFIKPVFGAQGYGVTKIWKVENGVALVKEKGEPVIFPSVNELEAELEKIVLSKSHIIQMGIPLAEYNGSSFDIRLMMMKDKANNWAYKGMMAKISGSDSIITNVAYGGGSKKDIEEVLVSSFNIDNQRAAEIMSEIIELGFNCCNILENHCDEWQIGYDIAIAVNQKIWFIEANIKYPSHELFNGLKDPSIYQEIKELASFHSNKAR